MPLRLPLRPPPRLDRPDRALSLLLYGIGALLVAGIVHIVTILVLPSQSGADAYARVRSLAKGTLLQTTMAPPAAAGLFPYRDPAMAVSVCLYDLEEAPVSVSINVAEADYLTVSMHARHGRVFDALTNRSASHGRVALTLMTAAQMKAAETQDGDDGAMQELRVLAPETKGFVAVEALAPDPSAASVAEAEARKLLCRSLKR